MKNKLFGVLLFIETAALLLSALVAGHYHALTGETDLKAFLLSAAITGVVGLSFYLIGSRSKKKLGMKDTFLVVALSWVLFSCFGMLPFLLYGAVDNVTDAFFETMSGFTTTGSTILTNIDDMPHGILFWRSIMQWLGGLGIVVFTLAFIPSVAKGSRKMTLFAAEAPGLSVEKLAPTMQGTARILWIIYILLTGLCAICYRIGPMNTFDAICHAFTTIATGGFSTHQESIGYYHSNYLEYVCAGFMILSGINFAMYYFFVARRFDVLKKNEELKVYLCSIILLTLLFIGLFYVAPSIAGGTENQYASYPSGREDTFRTSLFHVSTMLSNTGFIGQNFNYDMWGMLFVIPTLLMLIVGGCAGSTSGGIKIIRVIVLFKFIKNALKELIHPTGMFSVKISGQTVDEFSVQRVCHFFTMFIILMVLNVIALTATGLDMGDATISFMTCFSNLGIGSGATGPTASFSDLPAASKWILSFDMLIGRLEILTIALLFTPAFWRTK